jgi:hypothetical protein
LVEGGNGNVFIDVTQTGHGLVIGDYVRQDLTTPNTYVPALASSFLNAQGIGFVVDVPDANHFVLVQTGYVINELGVVPALPEGTALYLSPSSPGGVTSTKPSTAGQYIKPVAIITESAKSMWVLSDFPVAVPTGGGSGVQSVTDDGKGIVNVNNADIQNPIIEFDEVALANYVPFINALTNNSTFQNAVNNFVTAGTGGGTGGGCGGAKILEDFLSNVSNGDRMGSEGIYASVGSGSKSISAGQADHPGVLTLTAGTSDVLTVMAQSSIAAGAWNNFFPETTFEVSVQATLYGTRYFIGFLEAVSWNTQSNHLGFEIISTGSNSANVTGIYKDGTNPQLTTGTTAINKTDFYKFSIKVNTIGDEASLYINDVLLGTLALNGFTADVAPGIFKSNNSFGTPNNLELGVDYFYLITENVDRPTCGSTGSSITATAEQDIAAGQPVGMSASLDDKVALALITKYVNANLIGSATGLYNICEIAQDKYVVLYEQPTDFPVAFVAKIDRSTMSVSVGNQVTFGQGGAKVAKLDTDKYVILGYLSGPQSIRDEVYNVSGVTSTSAGTNNYGSSGFSGAPNSITSAGTDRIVYIRRDQFSPTGSKMQAISYSGAVGSIGSAVTLDANASSIYTVSYLDTDTVMTVQNSTLGSSTSIPCSVYTLTGVTFGSGTGTSIGTVGSNSSRSVGVSVVSPGVFLLRAQRTTSPVFSNLYLCHLSGSSIVTDQTSATDSDAVSGNLTPIGVSGKVYETCYTGVTATNRINEITVSGTTFTKKVASIGITFENAPLILLDSTNGYYYATNFKSSTQISTNIQGMANNFVGIAQSTVSRGAPVNVLIKGVDTHQANLSPGNNYVVVNGTFVISGDPTLPNRGVAKSATSIEI